MEMSGTKDKKKIKESWFTFLSPSRLFYKLSPIFIIGLLINPSSLLAQTFSFSFPTVDTTWIVPPCVGTVTVQVWGGGGAGGAATGNAGGAGGGGGAFSSSVLNVTAGTTYSLHVGTPGAGGSGAGGVGGDSWFQSTATLLAKGGAGGAGGANATGGNGGAAASGVGTIKYSGGKGGNYAYNTAKGGGGGGATAGKTADGAAGSAATSNNGGLGGVGSNGGGNGGTGGPSNAEGTDNSLCIVCGGGGGAGTNGTPGGHGSFGRVVIILPQPLVATVTSSQTICSGNSPAAFTASATGGFGGAYIYTWQSSVTDSISGFSTIGGAAASTYTSGVISATTWYRCIVSSTGCSVEDTAMAVKVLVMPLSGKLSFPQTICSGSTPDILTAIPSPANAQATYVWESSTVSSSSSFSTIPGATASTYSPPAASGAIWYNVILSAPGCNAYTATAGITTSSAPATCNAAGPSTIYNTNQFPLFKSSVGGSVTTGAWSIFSSSPAGTHNLNSTAQTNDPASVVFTPQTGFVGQVVLELTTNSNGCNVSTCKRTIDVLASSYTAVTFTVSGTSTWTVPSCVTTVTVQTWGAGGGGGGANVSANDGGGGGGGAFSQSVLTVSNGTVYNLSVGKGGAASYTTKGAKGGDTWFGSASTVMAKGGAGGLRNGAAGENGDPGVGGDAAAGYGQIKYSGGMGGTGGLYPGGGGGSSAGYAAKGNDGQGTNTGWPNGSKNAETPGGVAPPGGGNGGNGSQSDGGQGIGGTCPTLIAHPGESPGGGGGGGTNACNYKGEVGADGQIKILYGPSIPIFVTVTSKTICQGQNAVLVAASEYPTKFLWSNGATTDTITVSPASTTSYTVADVTGCANAVVAKVTVNAAFAAGVTSTTVCSGQPGTITASGASSYLWSTGETTNTFTASPLSTTTYSVSASNSGCALALTGTIYVNSASSLAVNSASICNGQTATLTASGGATSYSWAPATSLSSTAGASVTANPSSTITYTVTGTTSNCTTTALSTVTVSSLPISDAGADISICSGTTGNIGAPASGGNTYSWSPATGLSSSTASDPTVTLTNVTASPVVNTYTVTTNPGGCSSSDVVNVTANPQDDPSFSYNSSAFCAPSTDTPNHTAAGTFTINPAITPAINASTGLIDIQAGTTVGPYVITLTTSGACPGTSSVTVNVVANPDATFNYALPAYCQNATPNPTIIQPPGATAGTFSASPLGLVFVGTTGEINLAASSPNTYTVTNTIPAGGGCLATSKVTTITINAIPSVAVTSTVVCGGSAGSIKASGATAYTWSVTPDANTILSGPGDETLTDSPVNTTTYVVTGTTNGCSSTGQGTITVTSNPVVTVTNSNNCAGIPQTITASGAASYTWTGGVGGTVVISGIGYQKLTDTPAAPSTSYVVTGTTGGCTGSATGVIVVDPSPSVTVTNSSACLGFPATLTANPANNASLVWSLSGETSTSITKTPFTLGAHTYTVTVAGTNPACIDTAIATIFINPNPAIVVTSSPAVCLGATSTLTASGPATAYSWSPGGSVSNPLTVVGALGSTVYTVTGTITATGCTGTQTGTITVNPMPTVTVKDATICAGQTATLTASGATLYTWSPNIGSQASVPVTPGVSTTYTVTGTTSGCSDDAVANVTVNALPLVTVNSPIICNGQSTTLTAGGASTYSWLPVTGLSSSTGSIVTANPSSPITYTVTGTGSNGCVKTAISNVTVNANPVADPGSDLALVFPDSIQLYVTGGNNYFWSANATLSCTDCANPMATPSVTTTYCVKVTDANNCVDSACVKITVVIPCIVETDEVPNAFSPNNDGISDVWKLNGWENCYSDFSLIIYDRWGEKVFESNDPKTSWDGIYRGKPLDTAVFVYFISATLPNNEKITKKGNITLLR